MSQQHFSLQCMSLSLSCLAKNEERASESDRFFYQEVFLAVDVYSLEQPSIQIIPPI